MFNPGDTFHCWRESLIGNMIKKITKSKFSHTALFIRIDGEPFIIDSQADGTQLRHFDKWMAKYEYNFIVMRFTASIYPAKTHRQAALRYVGVKYGYADLLRHLLYRKTGLWLGLDKEHKRMVCSEYRMKVHDEFFDTEDLRIEKMSPKDVFEWERERGFDKVITYTK